MNKLAEVKWNDVSNGDGVCISIFVQGCPHHCLNCFNQITWDPNGGYEIPKDFIQTVLSKIKANGIQRNVNLLGGEPLYEKNQSFIKYLIQEIRKVYPNIKIFLWTGYTLEELQRMKNENIEYILNNINFLIDGRFIEKEKDLTLWLRGSRNQNIYMLTKEKKYIKIKEKKDIEKYE